MITCVGVTAENIVLLSAVLNPKNTAQKCRLLGRQKICVREKKHLKSILDISLLEICDILKIAMLPIKRSLKLLFGDQ